MAATRAHSKTMRAARFPGYGGIGDIELVPTVRPTPQPDEALIKVRAASVNQYDWHFLTGKPYVSRPIFGLRRPKVNGLGADLAGVVDEVGSLVTGFAPGDEVFGEVNGEGPGHPHLDLGSFADYVCVSADYIELKPASLSFVEAAAVPLAAITAYQGLHHYGRLQAGQSVLINGASGGVGTFAVQIAKALGAEVTGVCGTRNVDTVCSLGADHVVDYMRDDFVAQGAYYDLILDNVGNRSLRECRRLLRPRGMYLASFGQPQHDVFGPMAMLARMKLLNAVVSQQMLTLHQHRNTTDLGDIKELIDAGSVRPVIDRTFRLDEVKEALAYLEEGHAGGKVVITT